MNSAIRIQMSRLMHKSRFHPANSGYTLLEVVLALALSVVLLGGVSMAIHGHMLLLREQQAEIERGQLARQALFMISKDIRAAIQYKPIESSALDELIDTLESASDAVAELTGEEVVEEEEPAESLYAPTRPGLYGSATELKVDISRLPRKDQYNIVTFSDGTQSDIPSDVKTVSYFVRNDSNFEEDLSSTNVNIDETMGLVRRSIDRAVSRYADDYGSSLQLEDYEEVLAREISQIEFRYWDQEAETWVTEWDSDEMLGLPKAVEISIAVGKAAVNDDEQDLRKIYRTVVYLPVAEIILPEVDLEMTDESTDAISDDTLGAAAEAAEAAGVSR